MEFITQKIALQRVINLEREKDLVRETLNLKKKEKKAE